MASSKVGDVTNGGAERGEDNNDKNTGGNDRSASEEAAKCAICLGDIENRSCTNSCPHLFCYRCLFEWSKVRQVCPLCKIPFRSINFNFRGNDEHDEYIVSGPVGRLGFVSINPFDNDRRGFIDGVPGDVINNAGQVIGHQVLIPGIQNRRRLYNSGQWVHTVGQLSTLETGGVFTSTVDYMRTYPSTRNRLRHWLYRDLAILLGRRYSRTRLATIYDYIQVLLGLYDVRSPEFHTRMYRFFGLRTYQFQNELFHFILSGMSLVEYDSVAEYHPPTSTQSFSGCISPPEVITLDDEDEREGNGQRLNAVIMDHDMPLEEPQVSNAAAAVTTSNSNYFNAGNGDESSRSGRGNGIENPVTCSSPVAGPSSSCREKLTLCVNTFISSDEEEEATGVRAENSRPTLIAISSDRDTDMSGGINAIQSSRVTDVTQPSSSSNCLPVIASSSSSIGAQSNTVISSPMPVQNAGECLLTERQERKQSPKERKRRRVRVLYSSDSSDSEPPKCVQSSYLKKIKFAGKWEYHGAPSCPCTRCTTEFSESSDDSTESDND